jgi:hypothetical protein
VVVWRIPARGGEVWVQSGGEGGHQRGVASVREERGGNGDKVAISEGFVHFL